MGTARKPHNDWAGYRCELRNRFSGGHTVIVDCRLAEEQGAAWVADWREEGGRYAVVCNSHAVSIHATSMAEARARMKNPDVFCEACRTQSEA